MSIWSKADLKTLVYQYESLSSEDQNDLKNFLNTSFPPKIVEKQLLMQREAINNNIKNRQILSSTTQYYPECIRSENVRGQSKDLSEYAIILTAGGDGERLRTSLNKMGIPNDQLLDFTKATYPLPHFGNKYGTLSVNLSLISNLCRDNSIDIPVVITTGPQGSTTAKVIPIIVCKNNNFNIRNLKIIQQDLRIHFSQKGQIVPTYKNYKSRPVTNPDETGGPIMKLKSPLPGTSESTLDWLSKLGCKKIILLQATALYDPQIIITMATAGKKYDGLGIGIRRASFPASDPYGTYVVLEKNNKKKLVIIESEIRNSRTRSLKNEDGTYYLPYNTGFYVFDLTIIRENSLPDYATPPKEIIPGIEKSPKIGYAATDIISFAKNPAVLTIPKKSFCVLKKYEDLEKLAEIGERYSLF